MSASWIADRIEHWPIEKLVPYARNARTHSQEQIAAIAASIAEFGFTNPILAGSDGVIVAGHGRLAAARKSGGERLVGVGLDGEIDVIFRQEGERRAWGLDDASAQPTIVIERSYGSK